MIWGLHFSRLCWKSKIKVKVQSRAFRRQLRTIIKLVRLLLLPFRRAKVPAILALTQGGLKYWSLGWKSYRLGHCQAVQKCTIKTVVLISHELFENEDLCKFLAVLWELRHDLHEIFSIDTNLWSCFRGFDWQGLDLLKVFFRRYFFYSFHYLVFSIFAYLGLTQVFRRSFSWPWP